MAIEEFLGEERKGLEIMKRIEISRKRIREENGIGKND